VLLAFIGLPCAAASLTVRVLDERGAPVPRVAVYATAAAGSAAPSAPAPATAVMDQVHNAFVPHMLVVAKGTSVLFPNSDSVSHHVYSFSDAKAFELGLYKGDVYPPVQFDKPGVVVLGCNIHDGMLGYVIVVDTPHFAMTDDRGAVRLDGLAPGEYAVDLWTPRARPSGLPPTSRVVVAESQSNETQLALRGKLAPDHEHTAPGLPWQRY
jgi:plastocyanin